MGFCCCLGLVWLLRGFLLSLGGQSPWLLSDIFLHPVHINSNSHDPILDLVMTSSCMTSMFKHLALCLTTTSPQYPSSTVSHPRWDPQTIEHTPLPLFSLPKLDSIACHSVPRFSPFCAHMALLSFPLSHHHWHVANLILVEPSSAYSSPAPEQQN